MKVALKIMNSVVPIEVPQKLINEIYEMERRRRVKIEMKSVIERLNHNEKIPYDVDYIMNCPDLFEVIMGNIDQDFDGTLDTIVENEIIDDDGELRLPQLEGGDKFVTDETVLGGVRIYKGANIEFMYIIGTEINGYKFNVYYDEKEKDFGVDIILTSAEVKDKLCQLPNLK
jgi:hypothetical protein